MSIRNFELEDKGAVLAIVDTFYNSPGVLHRIPPENFAAVYEDMCAGGTPLLRGLLIEANGMPAGYCLLSFSYSTEAGGLVVLIEEVFVQAAFRSHGLGSEVFDFLKNEYRSKAARLRLEVAPTNTKAIELYKRLGFEALPYEQMILEDF